MCSRDILFWINTFGWTFDPRLEITAVPFITWPYQDEATGEIVDALRKYDLLIKKSRDMGASWLCIAVFLWRWQFRPRQSFLMMSRKEDFVDKGIGTKGDPKTLFWKIDFLLENQPPWMTPMLTRNHLHLHNDENGSTIDGESTNKDAGRGDRRTAILLDEFAAVENGAGVLKASRDASPCRIFNSTPKGTGNAFYALTGTDIKQLEFHWSLHPDKANGLYHDAQGKARSPWYDGECKRAASSVDIAQELDIDFAASQSNFFDIAVLERIKREDIRPPYKSFRFKRESAGSKILGLEEDPKGDFHVWCHINRDLEAPGDRKYIAGVDVSTGSEASNSAITFCDDRTREKVAEYAAILVSPHELASIVLFLSKTVFLGCNEGAYLIWERNGPGQIFGHCIMDSGYQNLYYQRNETTSKRKRTDTPGWHSSKDSKIALLGEYRRALASGDFTQRSSQAITEAMDYIYNPTGSVVHSKSMSAEDPSGARDNHGDRVIADALAWWALKEIAAPVKPVTNDIPEQCPFTRRRSYVNKLRFQNYWGF